MTGHEKIVTSEKITLTVQEAAEQLNVSRPTLLNWTHLDGFPCFRAGRKILIPRQALIEWANLRAQEGAVL